MTLKRKLIVSAALLLATTTPSTAMDPGEYSEFQKLMHTPVRVLAEKADEILNTKYEGLQYRIMNQPAGIFPPASVPDYARANGTVATAYRIAAKKPDLIAGYACYDPACDKLKLPTLLHCFLADGKPGSYVEHASRIDACTSEALLVFLWSELGANAGQITGALRFMFDPAVHEGAATTLN